ncbi:auxin response factor 8-like [Hordeum vulgare]|nr:auxin response factor 8-like [Hordeum vulgare]
MPGGQRGQAPAVDAQLWLACAVSMCAVPPVGAAVYYFPQGHAEQATAAVDLSVARVPALLPYRVSVVRFMADEEVFAKIRLIPISHGDPAADVDAAAAEGRAEDDRTKPASFAKTSSLVEHDWRNSSRRAARTSPGRRRVPLAGLRGEHVRRAARRRRRLLLPTRPRRAGHAAVDLSVAHVPALLPYRVSVVRFMADEEVFTKIRLIPISHGDPAVDVGAAAAEGRAEDDRPKPASFAKTSLRLYN